MIKRRVLPLLAAVVLAGLAGCSTGVSGDAHPDEPVAAAPPDQSDQASQTPTTDPGSSSDTPTLAPGQEPGLDDYNDDGQPDPLCGTQDFGGGLVLRIPCTITTAHTPEDGTELVPDSLYRLPGPDLETPNTSTEPVFARAAGTDERVIIFVFASDNLFDTGKADLRAPDEMDAIIAIINDKLPGGAIQVRGHTDATGSAAANQALSEQRASTVQQYLTAHGVNASGVTAVGFGSTRPLVLEANADGSPNLKGRAFNRRVEIAVRLPKDA
jgi:outer membrane protein OmpA-like peptidoglycan-associated protein